MKKRDVGIIVLCMISLIVTLNSEGSIILRHGFSVRVMDSSAGTKPMPRPIVSDLEGDGKNEFIAPQGSNKLAVYSPSRMHRLRDFAEIPPVRQYVSENDLIGFNVGFTERPDLKKNSTKHRSQHVCVVTSDYEVIFLDEKLNELWKTRIPDTERSIFVPDTASVLVLPYNIHKGDKGMVVVGLDTKVELEEDPDSDSPLLSGQGNAVHFSYYAFEAAKGELRWKHDASSFRVEDAEDFRASNFKMGLSHIALHQGQQDWRAFRRSMLTALPHHHDHPHHNRMTVRHFSKRKNQKKQQFGKGHDSKGVAYQESGHKKPGHDSYGEFGARVRGLRHGLADKMGRKDIRDGGVDPSVMPNVIVVHRPEGVEVLHLYTGRTLTELGPLQPGEVYDDVNGDTSIEVVKVHIVNTKRLDNDDYRGHVRCNGIIQTGLPGLHHEVLWNGSICVNNGLIQELEMLKHLMSHNRWGEKDFTAETTAAAPPLVVHRRVAEYQGLHKMQANVLFYTNTGLISNVDPKAGKMLWQVETNSVFDTTPIDPEEEAMTDDISGFTLRGANPHHKKDHAVRHFPHMAPYSLPALHATRAHQRKMRTERNVVTVEDKPYILVLGDQMLTILHSDDGHKVVEIELEGEPVGPVLIGDVNSDATQDIIVATQRGYYAYLVHHRGGTSVLSFLMLCAMAMLALLFITQRVQHMGENQYGLS